MSFNLDKQNILSIIEKEFGWLAIWDGKYSSFDGEFNGRRLHDKGFEHYSGLVKYCLTNEDFNGYVVKFCIDKEFDYCEREYTNYLAAVARDLQEYFPYTDYLCKIGKYKLYVQEEAEVDEEAVTSTWVEAINSSLDGNYEDNEDREYDSIWDYIDEMSDEERVLITFKNDRLANFCYDYVINDLHSGNFGFINGHLVIIDFSGFGYWVRNRSF